MFGLRDASRIQSSRFPLPILVVTDEAASAGMSIPSSAWINETREKNQVNIMDVSLGLKNDLDEGGSPGGGANGIGADVRSGLCTYNAK